MGSVFLFPDFTDSIGNASWNTKLRNIKNSLESASGVLITDKPLIKSVTDIAKPYIDETRTTTEKMQTTIETKTQEIQQAADSVKKAYDALEWAKNDVKKITTFGSGS